MKAISPIIAAVLLIIVTVTIATLVSGWFSTITKKESCISDEEFWEDIEIRIENTIIEENKIIFDLVIIKSEKNITAIKERFVPLNEELQTSESLFLPAVMSVNDRMTIEHQFRKVDFVPNGTLHVFFKPNITSSCEYQHLVRIMGNEK